MSEIITGILSFLGGLLTCSIVTKINKQENNFLNFFGSNHSVNQKNENDKSNK